MASTLNLSNYVDNDNDNDDDYESVGDIVFVEPDKHTVLIGNAGSLTSAGQRLVFGDPSKNQKLKCNKGKMPVISEAFILLKNDGKEQKREYFYNTIIHGKISVI